MIKHHEKFRLPDQALNNDFFVEVNWKPDDNELNECKIIKFTFPNGSKALVKKEHLLSVIFTMGTPEEQVKLTPQTLTKVRWYETILGIKATKDIRKGEMINVPVKLTLPPIEEEVIGELKKDMAQKHRLILPA